MTTTPPERPSAATEVSPTQHVLVVGAGATGSQTATVCALAGRTGHLVGTEPGSLTRAETQLRARTGSRVATGRLTEAQLFARLDRATAPATAPATGA